jgi:hypothetical protein
LLPAGDKLCQATYQGRDEGAGKYGGGGVLAAAKIERKPLQDRPTGLRNGGMKRFLVFAVLFPPLALVVFNAPDVILHHDFRLLDLMTLSQ